jgi:hypothetical protein
MIHLLVLVKNHHPESFCFGTVRVPVRAYSLREAPIISRPTYYGDPYVLDSSRWIKQLSRGRPCELFPERSESDYGPSGSGKDVGVELGSHLNLKVQVQVLRMTNSIYLIDIRLSNHTASRRAVCL